MWAICSGNFFGDETQSIECKVYISMWKTTTKFVCLSHCVLSQFVNFRFFLLIIKCYLNRFLVKYSVSVLYNNTWKIKTAKFFFCIYMYFTFDVQFSQRFTMFVCEFLDWTCFSSDIWVRNILTQVTFILAKRDFHSEILVLKIVWASAYATQAQT